MADKNEPSYADLVYEVLRAAQNPLTFQEIFDAVNRRRPVTTRDPKGTIRGVLAQGRQLVNVGNGRFGYLPNLLPGSLLRLPLSNRNPARHPLVYSDEVRQALWPSFLEIQKRRNEEPVTARLPNGREVALSLTFLGPGVWGSPMPTQLGQYLTEKHAARGDSLLFRVVDANGSAEVQFESKRKRDKAAVTKRNQELANAAEQILRRNPSRELSNWDLVIALLGRGAYRSDVAPDSLVKVLGADRRFASAGLGAWILAKAVTPEMQAYFQERKELEAELLVPFGDTASELGEVPTILDARRALEKSMAEIGAFLSEQEFSSIDEANALLQDLLSKGGELPKRRSMTPVEEAQNLMYDAWESPSQQKRLQLARKALAISPDCADACVLLAEETARNAKEAADLYAKGVAAGERALGKQAFKDDVGEFWGIIETRPYMRARLGLSQALWALNRRNEAIEHAQEMLRLNPNDNQGVRYQLLHWLLETGNNTEVEKLLARYPEDASADWLYAKALQAFRTEGDTKRARKLRAEAKKWNPHVLPYLLKRKRLPSQLPETIGLGDENEAVYYAAEQIGAWQGTPGALTWLAE